MSKISSWFNKPISLGSSSSSFAKSGPTNVEIGSLKKATQSVGEKVDRDNALARADRNNYKLSVDSYRYASTADELLMIMTKTDPDVSAGVWNFLRLANSGITFTGLNEKLMPDTKVQEALDNILLRFSGLLNFKDWRNHASINQVANTLLKYILIRGGSGLELVLGPNRTAEKLVIVDAVTVQFKHIKPGIFRPFQTNEDGKEVFLDIPTFMWDVLDADSSHPYETPPFLPVLQAILFNMSVMQDLERIVKRVAFPRISIKIIEETLRKFAPLAAQADPGKMTLWLREQKTSIASSLSDLAPEDAAVFFDSLDVNILETKANAQVDFRPLKEVIDQRIIAGLKSLPTILGRQFSSSQTLSGIESLLYAKSIRSLQEVVEGMLTRALTLAIRLEGVKGFVRVKYRPVTLKPDSELEAFRALEQSRVLEQLSLGLLTDEEAAEALTGNPHLPSGYKRLSGTGFYKSNSTEAAQAVASTRNPTAEESVGGGRERS